jgi:hypothetical protein
VAAFVCAREGRLMRSDRGVDAPAHRTRRVGVSAPARYAGRDNQATAFSAAKEALMVYDRALRHPDSDGGAGGAVRPAVRSDPGPGRTDGEQPAKIRAFDQKLGASAAKSDEHWARQPVVTGTGASHVKSFHCKLTGESLEFLDRQINEWLDAHPNFEVKFVTSSVGDWTGKLKEPNLILQVWV